jgi:glycosyltransferase involved in cell wall biosynthesis
MKKVLLITASFPYIGGEQFLETEVSYYKDLELIIMPKVKYKEIRDIPNNIKVDNFLSEQSSLKNKYIYLFKLLKTTIFYKELFSEISFNLKKMKIFLSSIATYQIYYEIFDIYFCKIKDIENFIVYTYWNDEATYALQKLKLKYRYKLISRIHRGDLYKERKLFNYMPLKKHFTNNIDTLYTITQSANEYLVKTYGFDKSILKLSRLGVEDLSIVSMPTKDNEMHIVSCSFLTEVKQVDKIIKSLDVLSDKIHHINFKWSHIGDGILYKELLQFAKNKLGDKKNVQFEFLGNLENRKVYEFYRDNNIDVFINVSKSEGVPVSIMEAMSCHIPIVAPNIGGIKDMIISGYNGFLLSNKCSNDEIVESLKNINFFKDDKIRKNSYNLFLKKYNAKKNYSNFIESIINH